MARDQNRSEQFEWVNAWADSAKADRAPDAIGPAPVIAPTAHMLDDRLMRDIAEIERTRDALATLPVGNFSAKRRTQAFTLVPTRTSDSAPVMIGGVLALVMLTVFGAAAAVTKLSR